MPRRLALTNDQLDALMALPTTEAEIIQHYTLSKEDISIICRRRRSWNRLGFAIQLCGLRYPGRLLRPGELVPEAIVRYVAQQLDVLPEDLADYAARSQTRYDQLDALRREFGYSSITQPDRRSLQAWLLPVALGTIRSEVVAEALMSELRRRQIAAPGPSVIENMVATAVAHADRRVTELLTEDLADAQRKALDDLISLREGGRESHLSWARQVSGALNQRSFARLLDQLEYLRAIGVPENAATAVHPDRLRQLAREGARFSARHLAALSTARRRATLIATVLDTLPRVTDDAISTFDRLIGRLFRRAERRAGEALQRDARSLNDKVKLLARLGQALIDAKDGDADVFGAVESIIGWPQLKVAVSDAKRLVRGDGPDYAAVAESSHALLRRIGPALLSAFQFEGVAPTTSLLKAIDRLRTFYMGARKTPPKDMPRDFIRRAWKGSVFDGDKLDFRAYELCVFVELRDRLRAGDVWVRGSRQYRAVNDQLLPKKVFEVMAASGPLPVAIPQSAAEFIGQRKALLRRRMQEVAAKAEQGALADVRISNSGFKITPLNAATPEAAESLGARLYGLLPRMKITELLEEVNQWTGFADAFTHLRSGVLPDQRVILSAILADATNLGFTRMAEACSAVTYKQLVWAGAWHVREDTHAHALEKLVRQQQAHHLAALFGDGSSSSSDGQHFPLGGRAEVTGSVNPHKGSEPAISIYTHLSSRFAPYSAKTISATEGEAPYVLDGLINSGAPIGIATHHTDGGGVSDHVFGLCPMLGFRFAPRIPNLNDRRLYTFDPAARAGALAPFVGGRIDEDLIAAYWDEVLRLGTSIRTGHVSASLMLKRLGSYPRQNGLALALRELGRIERTLFTLDWLEDPALRRKTTIELNKGESRNALARAVCFHRLGRFRDRTHEGRQCRADSLNLVVAAIVLWNTVYLGRAVDALRAGGEHIEKDLLAHIAPLGWQHINLTGDYLWGEIRNDPQNWKPLRQKIDLFAAA